MPPPMLGIAEMLNRSQSESGSENSDESAKLVSHVGSEPKLKVNTSNSRVDKLSRSKIHPALLQHKKLLDIALRRKTTPKRISNTKTCGSKLHRKSLEAGLRVRLVCAPSLYEIFHQLTPSTSRGECLHHIVADASRYSLISTEVTGKLPSMRGKSASGFTAADYSIPRRHTELEATPCFFQQGSFDTKTVRLIDNNLVNLAGVPSKVLKSLTYDKSTTESGHSVQDGPQEFVKTFNHLDTAISFLFRKQAYSLIRVTKSASSNTEGSSIVKLETAKPGDPLLIDDGELAEDMAASLGSPGQSPSNLFIKKVVARPRYKVDMKLYFVPTDCAMSLYVDPRSFERDLINGVIDAEATTDRVICTTFHPDAVLESVQNLIAQSNGLEGGYNLQVPNHITENLRKYMRSPSEADIRNSTGSNSSSGSVSTSRSSVFSSVASSSSSVSAESHSVKPQGRG